MASVSAVSAVSAAATKTACIATNTQKTISRSRENTMAMVRGNSKSSVSTVDTAVSALKAGRMIIVVDSEYRENEGDLVCAAETISAEQVDFMLRHGRGVLCVPTVAEVANRLRLAPVVSSEINTAPMRTHFLTPVDHRTAGTGASAEGRAKTIRSFCETASHADDFVQPGHVWPLLAKEGGVLRRAGHTEATVDLLRMAGMQPTGALIEVLGGHGDGMADFQELVALSGQFDIPLVTIEELIRYRRLREQLVSREFETMLESRHGSIRVIVYRVEHESDEPLALVWGDITSVQEPLVRVHSSCFTGDVLGSLRCDCGDQLEMAMEMIHREGAGAVVYLPQEGRGIGLVAKLKAYHLQDNGLDTVEANHMLGFQADQRDYMVGLQILKDLGLSRVRLLTNNPKKTESFEYAWDLKVVEQVPIIAPPETHRERYLAAKRDKLGHLLP